MNFKEPETGCRNYASRWSGLALFNVEVLVGVVGESHDGVTLIGPEPVVGIHEFFPIGRQHNNGRWWRWRRWGQRGPRRGLASSFDEPAQGISGAWRFAGRRGIVGAAAVRCFVPWPVVVAVVGLLGGSDFKGDRRTLLVPGIQRTLELCKRGDRTST